jgi:hypothetical protein
MDAPLDARLGDQVGKPETGRDHADRAHHGRPIRVDVIRRAGEPVAAGCRHVLAEGIHRQVVLLGQRTHPPCDQRRLDRRAAGGIHGNRDGGKLLQLEGALDRLGQVVQRHATPADAHLPDYPGEAQHADNRRAGRLP